MHDTTENRPEGNGGLTELQALGYFGLIDVLHNCLFISISILLIQVALFPSLKTNKK